MKEQDRVKTKIIDQITKQKKDVEGVLYTSRRVRKIQHDEIQKLKWNLFLAFTLGYFTTFGVALLHTTLYVNDCRNAP